jgi:hypothetical protein
VKDRMRRPHTQLKAYSDCWTESHSGNKPPIVLPTLQLQVINPLPTATATLPNGTHRHEWPDIDRRIAAIGTHHTISSSR